MKPATLSTLVVLFAVPIVAVVAQGNSIDPDHKMMMDKLHITTPLRPGPAGMLNRDGTAPANFANYDETKAMAKSPVPPLLAMANGRKITTAAQWQQRRKELFEFFDREIYGRVPAAAQTIKVTWEVTNTAQGMSGTIPTVTRTLVGHVDPTYYPAITVDITATVTTPANAAGKVPVIFQWAGGTGPGAGGAGRAGGLVPALPTIAQLQTALTLTPEQSATIQPLLAKAQQDITATPANAATVRTALTNSISAVLTDAQKPQLAQAFIGGRAGGAAGGARASGPPAPPPAPVPPFPNGATTWQQASISLGWGYGSIYAASIQADGGGEALTKGIIGFINKGQYRQPDDWGGLRAWSWGMTKLMDYLETDPLVDARQVALEGHSRYGKATMVTMVYEPRLANGFVSSSGEAGAKLWRHLVGQQIESLANAEYYWEAGNIIKYGGPLTVDDLPVDQHQFIALVAPRPIFISGGEYIEGNGVPGTNSRYSGENWQDTPGTFMATAGASPVWKLLGKKPLSNKALGISFDVVPDPIAIKAKMPPPNTPLIDGDIAFRQHDQGHTDAPNWSTFIEFCGHYFKSPGFKKN